MSELLTAASGLITSIGIVAGAGWTLYNFGLQRIAKPRVQLSASLVGNRRLSSHRRLAHIRIEAVNEGRTGVKKLHGNLSLSQLAVPSGQNLDYHRLTPALQNDRAEYQIFEAHSFLEPGERYSEDVIVEYATTAEHLQISVTLYGPDPSATWTFQRVFRVD